MVRSRTAVCRLTIAYDRLHQCIEPSLHLLWLIRAETRTDNERRRHTTLMLPTARYIRQQIRPGHVMTAVHVLLCAVPECVLRVLQ